ncbi:MAG: ABC transporter ATP-binding protein [Cyclobacteriaceae bacterium]|nr:ABC transporter ATP-binding protein [Cyclobacteriaceae bacterium]
MSQAVIIDHVSKNYGKIKALRNINLEIQQQEIFGLIGPDGAGKTSLFRILTTLLLPDEGRASILGQDVIRDYKKIRKIIGYMPGRFSLYQDLSVEENLSLFAAIFGTTIEENYDLVKEIYSQIEPFKKRKAGNLSGGMKQKLALSCALIHKPEILFLDEPTTGVDPVSRKEFWGMLRRLKDYGITILVSTPYMDEANLCDRIGLIQNGELLSVNTPEQLKSEYPNRLFAIHSEKKYQILQSLKGYENTHSIFSFGDEIHYVDKRKNAIPEVLENDFNGLDLPEFKLKEIQPTVEDCFLELMQQK